MFKFYDEEVISKILLMFNVKKIIISSLSDNIFYNKIFEYCDGNDVNYFLINSEYKSGENFIKDCILNELSDFGNYDAIFLNDDPNWYTVFNELQIIKETNNDFPLVFICNAVFPYKRRDAYFDPKVIPKEFLNDCSDGLNINDINIDDGFYHANQENTPKNGVLTAVEDFLAQNNDIGLCNFKLLNGIIILYPKNTSSQEKFSKLEEELGEIPLEYDDILDFQIENRILKDHLKNSSVSQYDLKSLEEFKNYADEKEKIISDYEYQIKIGNDTINNKNSQINDINSKLSLKDSQIKNYESKLINNTNELNDLNSKLSLKDSQIENYESKLIDNANELNDLNLKLEEANSEIVLLNHKLDENEHKFQDKQANLNNNLVIANNQISSLKENIKQKEYNFNARETKLIKELEDNNNQLNNVNSEINRLTENSNNLKSMLDEKEADISSLKQLLSSKDMELNNKNNQINDLNNSISNKENIINEEKNTFNSLKREYMSQLSKLDTNEYCISCYKEKIENNHLEIQYLKKDSFIKKLLNPFSYLYLILKSNPKELSLNYKLYKAMKNSNCFDIGYYLNNNKDLLESKWCKYFSPELHYVCNGFKENRKFNKKYFNRNSKQELLDYILKCSS